MLRNTLLKATKVHYFPKLYNPNKLISYLSFFLSIWKRY